MKKNMGTIDSLVRLTIGYFLYGKSIQRRSNILLFISAMTIAEGITRFCPFYHFLNLSTNHRGFNLHQMLK